MSYTGSAAGLLKLIGSAGNAPSSGPPPSAGDSGVAAQAVAVTALYVALSALANGSSLTSENDVDIILARVETKLKSGMNLPNLLAGKANKGDIEATRKFLDDLKQKTKSALLAKLIKSKEAQLLKEALEKSAHRKQLDIENKDDLTAAVAAFILYMTVEILELPPTMSNMSAILALIARKKMNFKGTLKSSLNGRKLGLVQGGGKPRKKEISSDIITISKENIGVLKLAGFNPNG